MNFEKVKKVKNSRIFTVLDAILVAVLTVAIVLSFVLVYRAPARIVAVTAPGFSREVPLADDAVIKLEHITVHIEGGKVWVTDSDCPDKICEHTGVISRAGQTIVCLPNGIVVTIVGEGDLNWELGR